MATIYADAQGRILRALLDEEAEARYSDAPAEAAHTLTFDEVTNVLLVAALRASTDDWRLVGGVLRRGGQMASIAAEGEDRAQRGQLASSAGQLRAYLALNAPTQAQSTAALRVLIRLVLFLARKQLGRADL